MVNQWADTVLAASAQGSVWRKALRTFLNLAFGRLKNFRAGRHWSGQSANQVSKRVRWWQSPTIIAHINRNICGEPIARIGGGVCKLIEQRFPGQVFARAVSIGCGHGAKEIEYVKSGLVEEFHLYELSKLRVEEGRRLAAQAGVADRVAFYNEDGLNRRQPGAFDMVYWSGSLHHMLDVDMAISWSREALRPGGLFVMDDFVGPDRMQWSDRMLKYASWVRRSLPARYMKSPHRSGESLPVRAKKPNRVRLILKDPTECADSSRIIPCLRKWFPDAEIKLTGGAIYHLALNDVLHNIDEVDDKALLEKLMRIDDLCTRLGEFHYGVTVVQKVDPA